jgi:nucleoside-diphosphate-sugar epimerase
LIDATAYNTDHVGQLIAVQGSVGHFIVVSSASVYRDGLGRTLDEASQTGFPELPDPIPETHPTVDPGPATYSTRKVALERHLLDEATAPVTVLRPCAIYGIGSRHPREWWFVKRILDRRPAIPMAYRGASRFHTSSVANIAALIRVAVGTAGAEYRRPVGPYRSRHRGVYHAASRLRWSDRGSPRRGIPSNDRPNAMVRATPVRGGLSGCHCTTLLTGHDL